MTSNYDRHIFRQLEEVLKKCDNLSQEIKDIKKQHKQEIYELNQKHEKEVKKLNEKITSLEKVDILEGKYIFMEILKIVKYQKSVKISQQ